MEEKPQLEEATFKFSQEANCLSSEDEFEEVEIRLVSSLGVDREKNNYFWILKTDGWAINNTDDLKSLFARIEKILENE